VLSNTSTTHKAEECWTATGKDNIRIDNKPFENPLSIIVLQVECQVLLVSVEHEEPSTRAVVIPSALAWTFASLTPSMSFALIGVVVGEFIGGESGGGLG
jgi:hypothetical protein